MTLKVELSDKEVQFLRRLLDIHFQSFNKHRVDFSELLSEFPVHELLTLPDPIYMKLEKATLQEISAYEL